MGIGEMIMMHRKNFLVWTFVLLICVGYQIAIFSEASARDCWAADYNGYQLYVVSESVNQERGGAINAYVKYVRGGELSYGLHYIFTRDEGVWWFATRRTKNEPYLRGGDANASSYAWRVLRTCQECL